MLLKRFLREGRERCVAPGLEREGKNYRRAGEEGGAAKHIRRSHARAGNPGERAELCGMVWCGAVP